VRKVFIVDPTLVADALREGRTLVVDVGDHHSKVTLGPASKYAQPIAVAKRA
jgi:hypothetical protein